MNEDLIRKVVDNVLQRLTASVPNSPVLDRAPARLEYFAPWTGEIFPAAEATIPAQPRVPAAHPSQEKLAIGEATEAASVRELVEFLETQKCSIEPDKPCDHCGTCRTLGF